MTRRLVPLARRGPLGVIFAITSMPVGGAETLLVELVRRMDRQRFRPEVCCLKQPGPLGEVLRAELPLWSHMLAHKYDLRVLPRLVRLLRRRRTDAVITVGTGGDKMFWGRLAGWLAGVPVICSALHSTGFPDRVEWLNRLLAPITDAFIAVARPHARYLAEHEGCPAHKVRVIANGVDAERFRPLPPSPALRDALGLPADGPVAAIVAALRPEKNHPLFLQAAAAVLAQIPQARFLVVGDGPQRDLLVDIARGLGIAQSVRFLGTRSDIPEILALCDVFVLSSHMEANPVSILEAAACAKPVVATRVGSVPETVHDGKTGYLVPPDDAQALASRMVELFQSPAKARAMGQAGRQSVVMHWSIQRMVQGYQDLIEEIYTFKAGAAEGSRVRALDARAS